MRSGRRPQTSVWSALNAGQVRWPPYRTLAVLDALAAVTDPATTPAPFHAIRPACCSTSIATPKRSATATGLDRGAGDPLLESALLERLGTAQMRQGRSAEANLAYARSRALQEELLAAGDERVVPVFEQSAQALEAAGRPEQAAELRRKLAARARAR